MTIHTIDPTCITPEWLRAQSLQGLEALAARLKERLIAVCAQNGGHIGASIGMVELAIALHRVFDLTQDKVVWDVGHQAYAHKLLTGRFDRFDTLRLKDGISGFLNRGESPYDAFGAGHASTSLSAAMGIAEAFRHLGETRWSIAVIGDGALTGGLAYEALNQIGYRRSPVLVILNDNGLSIDENVGALHDRFTEAHASGDFSTVAAWFQSYGFAYRGPYDGHDLGGLIDTLSTLTLEQLPLVLHLKTQKGKGYLPAEEDPIKYHGLGPYDLKTGKVLTKPAPPTYTDVFAQTLIELAKLDPHLIAVTAAMPSGTGLRKFGKAFPNQLYDVGIAEPHAVLLAAGMATEAIRPFVAIYSTFLQRAYDQIVHDVCIQNLPVVFALDRAGLVGNDGATHQGVYDLSYLRCLPNMVIMAPKDENELQHMIYTAYRHTQGPIAFRYPRGSGYGVAMDAELYALPIGKGELLLDSDHPELTILAVGQTVVPALRAAKVLSQEGTHVCVVNARFVKPLDKELIDYTVSRSGKVMTVEENAAMGGFGSAVLEYLSERHLPFHLKRLALPDAVIEHATQPEQRALCGVDEAAIYDEAKRFLAKDRAFARIIK